MTESGIEQLKIEYARARKRFEEAKRAYAHACANQIVLHERVRATEADLVNKLDWEPYPEAAVTAFARARYKLDVSDLERDALRAAEMDAGALERRILSTLSTLLGFAQ